MAVKRRRRFTRTLRRTGPKVARKTKTKPVPVEPVEPALEIIPAREITPAERATLRSNLNSPLTKFELFPYLPVEVRKEIWDLVKPEPRRIDVIFKDNGATREHKFIAKMPALLHVCKESREEMKKTYTYVFKHPRAVNGCYMDLKRDVLNFHRQWSLQQLFCFVHRSESKVELGRVQRLGLSAGNLDKLMRNTPRHKVSNFLLAFQSLKEIIVVDCPHHCTAADAHFMDGFWPSTPYYCTALQYVLNLRSEQRYSDMPRHYKGLSVKLITEFPSPVFTHTSSCFRSGFLRWDVKISPLPPM